jgi:hypothetical protein
VRCIYAIVVESKLDWVSVPSVVLTANL